MTDSLRMQFDKALIGLLEAIEEKPNGYEITTLSFDHIRTIKAHAKVVRTIYEAIRQEKPE